MMRIMAIGCVLSLLFAVPAFAIIDSFFDIWTEAVWTGPPYGNFAHEYRIAEQRLDGSFAELCFGEVKVTYIQNGAGSPIPTDSRLHNSAGPGGGFAVDSFFDITYRLDLGGPDFVVDSFFDITYDMQRTTGGPASVVVINPSAPPGSVDSFFDVFFVDSFFDITYRVDFGGGRVHDQNLSGTVAPGLRLTGVRVEMRNAFAPDSFFDVFFDVHLDDAVLCCDAATPLLSVGMSGQIHEEPIGDGPSSFGTIKSLYRD